MSSLGQVYLHIIFSTKNRTRFLQNKSLRLELHNYLGGTCRNLGCPSLIVGGEDHVHILCRFSRTTTIAVLVGELKRESSKWIKTKDLALQQFHWQTGYGVFSVGRNEVEMVREYIANQEEHHKVESFQDEFLRLLKEYGVEYDERYVWD